MENDRIDATYFFDVEQATGGHKLSRAEHIEQNTFLASFFTDKNTTETRRGKTKLALLDVEAQSVKWVTGEPEHEQMGYPFKVYVEKDKKTLH